MATRKPNRPVPVLLLLVVSIAFTQKTAAQTNIIFQDDFEGQSIFGGWDGAEGCCTYSGTFNSTIKRTGRQSMRVELRRSDAEVGGSKRAELTDNSYPIPPETNRRWWSFSNYLPADFGRDSVHEILAQWHDRPKTSTVSLNPPLSLQIYKGNWIIELRYDSIDVNLDRGANIKLKTFNLGPWQRGVWNDWVFNYNYSYNNDGSLKVWKNGQLVLDYTGKNYYNGSYDPFFKIGLYRWVWSPSWPSRLEQSVYNTRYYYFDNVKIGNSKAILQDFLIPNPAVTNISPIANVRDKQTISLPIHTATILGNSSTDPDGFIASYQWQLESGPSMPAMASTTAANLRISGMIQGTYTFRLTVTDNLGAKSYASSIVEVTGNNIPNKLPVLQTGKTILVTLPTNTATLSALGSYDPDGTLISGQWIQESGPSMATIQHANTYTPIVSALVKGSYYFKVWAMDNRGGYSSDYVHVYVDGNSPTPPAQPVNKKPVSNAGSTQSFQAIYSTISLNGSASYDPDGFISKYKWVQESGPAATMTSPDSPRNTIRNIVAGSYAFRLIVTDNGALSDTSRVTINVLPVTNTGISSPNISMPEEWPVDANTAWSNNWKWPGKALAIFPNPAREKLFVNLNSVYIGTAAIKIFNYLGALVYQCSFQKRAAIHTQVIDIGRLNQGSYFVQVLEGSRSSGMEKLLKFE